MAAVQDRPVIIIGGGIGGLATALALALKGLPSVLLEQSAEFREVGAGIQLGPNVFRRFETLGIRAAIEADAVFPENLIMRDALTGEEVTRLPMGEQARAHWGMPYAVTHRADLHNTLLQACLAQTPITLRTSARVTGWQDAGDSVSVTLADGETIEGSSLVACDGLWSQVREQIVGDGKPRVSGHIAYRAVLPAGEVPPDQFENNVVLWAGPKTHLVHYPLRRGTLFNLVAVFHSNRYEEGWNSFGDVAELNERFQNQQPQVHKLLDKIDSWRMWVLCDREPVANWTRGRIALLGDAAHPMLQYLAQGACMAIEDAVCLADKLAARRDDPNAAFLAYQQERYLRTARVQVMARVYGDFYHATGPVRELRNMALGSRTKAQAYAGNDWLYGG
ncbi:MAG: 3-hydroxybenzoate 6-monooxygenase [Ferrovibrio sp.]|uniref:3-hydroxybenzoate 6-monooxygenase n=1 Tax=Ferrovibrio sp. TaxID=1917215 RepID=UPI0026048BE6|nr:3-hydroxybenzoate 6-monooxygenase [Ferrovibrio sp.]MCW0234494.1 3-hydroxybenzoate 6-monooxygenase [Ferrovibrio sp.]